MSSVENIMSFIENVETQVYTQNRLSTFVAPEKQGFMSFTHLPNELLTSNLQVLSWAVQYMSTTTDFADTFFRYTPVPFLIESVTTPVRPSLTKPKSLSRT